MLRYLKENGFPVDLVFDTKDESGSNYRTTVTVDGQPMAEFSHLLADSRKFWAEGFFAGFKIGSGEVTGQAQEAPTGPETNDK